MDKVLKNKKIAILATDGVEQSELTKPWKALEDAGAITELISIHPGEIKAWQMKDWGDTYKVDKTIDSVSIDDYDGLVIPGGVINPDTMRLNKDAVEFVKNMYYEGKPIGAICHGPWMLVEANIVMGKKVTSWPSLHTDLKNAGAEWMDEEAVVDQGIVTSRKPDDIPAFNDKLIEEFSEGIHNRE